MASETTPFISIQLILGMLIFFLIAFLLILRKLEKKLRSKQQIMKPETYFPAKQQAATEHSFTELDAGTLQRQLNSPQTFKEKQTGKYKRKEKIHIEPLDSLLRIKAQLKEQSK